MNLSRLIFPAFGFILFTGIFIPGVTSCRHNDDISGLDTLCFDRDILPIFTSSCGDRTSATSTTQCHDPSSSGGYYLGNFPGIHDNVTPGDPMKSKVYTVLIDEWSIEAMMPPDQQLSLFNRSKIKVWIEQGAKESSTVCP
jgi:hypothetical protein